MLTPHAHSTDINQDSTSVRLAKLLCTV